MTESFRAQLCILLSSLALGLGTFGCASKILKVDNADEMLKTAEYDKQLEVVSLPEDEAQSGQLPPGAYVLLSAPPYTGSAPAEAAPANTAVNEATGKVAPTKTTKNGKPVKVLPTPGNLVPTPTPAKKAAQAKGSTAAVASAPAKRLPDYESSEGFVGRRPVVDPFRVGESVTIELSYFNVVAGDMTLEVRPFKQVNGRKAYNFAATAKSTSVFAMFYAVDDWAETFVDYEELVPFNYALHVKESKQLREVRSYFDWKNLQGFVWDRKVKDDKGVDEKKYEWKILPFAQNVFSAPFYLRMFKLEPGKRFQFRIGHEGKNLLMTADVLRREKIQTALGEMSTLVIRPKIEIDGVFKPMGDVLFWLTDDDRKFIVRIESKIKIGTVVGKVKAIKKE